MPNIKSILIIRTYDVFLRWFNGFIKEMEITISAGYAAKTADKTDLIGFSL